MNDDNDDAKETRWSPQSLKYLLGSVLQEKSASL
jgi:hypothetical protein